jgi:hypothetical protein
MNETVTTIDLLDDPETLASDMRAVQEFAEKGTPLDPAALARVRARAERVREKTRLKFGSVNIQDLLPPSTYEE